MSKFSITISGDSLAELQKEAMSFGSAAVVYGATSGPSTSGIAELKADEPRRGRPKKISLTQEEIDAQRREVEADERSPHSAADIRAEQQKQAAEAIRAQEAASDPFGEDDHAGASVTEFTHNQIIEIAKDLRDRKGVDAVKQVLDKCGAKCVSIDPKKTGNIQPAQYAKFAQLAKTL